jgi:hypothetical protein
VRDGSRNLKELLDTLPVAPTAARLAARGRWPSRRSRDTVGLAWLSDPFAFEPLHRRPVSGSLQRSVFGMVIRLAQ